MSELYQNIRKVIEESLDKGERHFILYPFGEIGSVVRNILVNSYGIKPEFVVDNHLCKYNPNIESNRIFNKIDCDDFTVIISTTKADIVDVLYEELEKYFSKENILKIIPNTEEEPFIEKSFDYVVDSIKWYTEYVIRNNEEKEKYEKKWLNIRSEYRKIHIYTIIVDTIGEILPRYFAYKEIKKEKDELYVLLPSIEIGTKRVANKYLLQYLGICDPQENLFWLYVLENHKNDVETEEIDRLRYRQKFDAYSYKAGSIVAHFKPNEEKMGMQRMREMGLHEPFVCVSARNSEYNLKTLPSDIGDYDYSHRNADFCIYTDTIRELGKSGIQTIKMGRFESKISPLDNCIDYAGLYGDDFDDLYIFSKCKFALVGSSGICAIPMLFAKPVLMVNAIPISFGCGGFRYTEHDLYIPKKLFDTKRKKYLNLEEILEYELNVGIFSSCYRKKGIKVVDNTREEILEAVNEMLLRIDNKWVDLEEDIENSKRYHEIFEKMKELQKNNQKNWIGGPLPYRLAASFIRRNKYLLDSSNDNN